MTWSLAQRELLVALAVPGPADAEVVFLHLLETHSPETTLPSLLLPSRCLCQAASGTDDLLHPVPVPGSQRRPTPLPG